jgi:hypothetical protein
VVAELRAVRLASTVRIGAFRELVRVVARLVVRISRGEPFVRQVSPNRFAAIATK